MHNIVMIAAMQYSKTEGISKKICMQAKGLSYNNKCILLCIGTNATIKILYENGELKKEESIDYKKNVKLCLGDISIEKILLKHALMLLKKEETDIMYIRHMIPCIPLLNLLGYARKRGIKIVYEIPTYPYYKEQYSISKNKIKTIIKLTLETIFWPIIYSKVNVITVITCNSKARKWKKMFSIPNGFSGQMNFYNRINCNDLNMIGVGTIYSYHGYEKVICDMENTNCRVSNGDVYFHIVGESQEINRLKRIVAEKGMQHNVVFYGKLYGEKLIEVYNKCNLGIGTLALSLRNADIDTAIKNIEYFSVGLPVVTSGYIFDLKADEEYYIIQKENKKMQFDKLLDFSNAFYQRDDSKDELEKVLYKFEWKNIMQSVIQKVE